MKKAFRSLAVFALLIAGVAHADCPKMDYAELKDKSDDALVKYCYKVVKEFHQASDLHSQSNKILIQYYQLSGRAPQDFEEEVKGYRATSDRCYAEYIRAKEMLDARKVTHLCN